MAMLAQRTRSGRCVRLHRIYAERHALDAFTSGRYLTQGGGTTSNGRCPRVEAARAPKAWCARHSFWYVALPSRRRRRLRVCSTMAAQAQDGTVLHDVAFAMPLPRFLRDCLARCRKHHATSMRNREMIAATVVSFWLVASPYNGVVSHLCGNSTQSQSASPLWTLPVFTRT